MRVSGSALWKLPEPWTHRAASTAPWKTTERVFHSYHRASSSPCSPESIPNVNLSTKPGQPQSCKLGVVSWELGVGSWELGVGS